MGFRTLAIEQRSSEVWRMLGAVKTEFPKFGDVIAKIKDRLDRRAAPRDAGVRRRRCARSCARRGAAGARGRALARACRQPRSRTRKPPPDDQVPAMFHVVAAGGANSTCCAAPHSPRRCGATRWNRCRSSRSTPRSNLRDCATRWCCSSQRRASSVRRPRGHAARARGHRAAGLRAGAQPRLRALRRLGQRRRLSGRIHPGLECEDE